MVNSDGVHLGQKDMTIKEARKILTPEQIIGTSNATLDEAIMSEQNGADYIAVGAIFPTNTKDNTRHAGIETLKIIRNQVNLPIVAISGINKTNVSKVIRAGADSIAVISAVNDADDPKKASIELTILIMDTKNQYP
jgi:thiamine-phosphate diphosphorylase